MKTISNEKKFSKKFNEFIQRISDLEDKRQSVVNAILKEEEKYRLLLKEMNFIEVKIDIDGRFLDVNSTYCEMFGKTRDELVGKTFMPLVNEDDLKTTANALESLKQPPFLSHHEQRAMTNNGWKWIAWSNKAIQDDDGNVVGSHGYGVDITDIKSP